MKCNEIRELFGDYWDLPESDWNRVRVDEHVKRCPECADEFEMWRESAELIQSTAAFAMGPHIVSQGNMSVKVMDRIYADESWRMPVASKMYSIPNHLRVRFTAIIACCMALFVCGFLYNLAAPGSAGSDMTTAGVITVGALGGEEGSEFAIEGLGGIEVASIGEPVVLAMPAVDSYPDFMLVLSFLGFIFALLTMNWFARIRS
ncbi:anti-sigma factor family protein [Paenibacillus alkalitolerans]|uniref:anti-sigma factor family protein n=1 Tax=Paenibacillus alkalitolerans TaxID=2799335 RepID=UPI0018F586C0|nr:zf-HC2 domain-containing protein [Paenibacillus alkalitolerans]